jgi:multidrug resistance efflux pump
MALIDSDSYRVTAFFEETKIPAVKLGEQADIYLLDGSPALRGHVESVARGITDRDNLAGPSSSSIPIRPSSGSGSPSGSRCAFISMMCRRVCWSARA